MADEEIKVTEEKKECKCECCEKIGKFFLLTGAMFLGTLLAILVASALLTPKMPQCPCHKGMMFKHQFGMEKQVPPMMMHPQFKGGEHFRKHGDFPKKFDKKFHSPDKKFPPKNIEN